MRPREGRGPGREVLSPAPTCQPAEGPLGTWGRPGPTATHPGPSPQGLRRMGMPWRWTGQRKASQSRPCARFWHRSSPL